MPSPFPGMDPCLEDPAGWPDVHHRLITGIGDQLAGAVSPRFHVRIEERVYVTEPEADPGFSVLIPDVTVTRPPRPEEAPVVRPGGAAITAPLVVEELFDDEIHDRYLEIRDARSHEIVTAIEVLSPANKVDGSRGREAMMEKRRRLLEGGASWLEIDLLRAGERLPRSAGWSAYCAYLRKHGRRGGLLWPFALRDPIPVIGVPLRPPHEDVPLDLGWVLSEVYDRARYADSIDYSRPLPLPPLSEEDAAWARQTVEAWRATRQGRTA